MIQTSQPSSNPAQESIMFQRPSRNLFRRALSFALAAVMTTVMLGGIDSLAQPDDSAPQWAQHSSSTVA